VTNRLVDTTRTKRGEKSPTDPQECCDWANARLCDPDREWIVTGNKDTPIALWRRNMPR
jgi:hypothetical protein